MPGSAVGMYRGTPSNSGGMNWLPMLERKRKRHGQEDEIHEARVVFGNRRQSLRTGR